MVKKDAYRNWKVDRESAFYKTYTMLIAHCTRILRANVTAEMDEKSDAYPKQHEVVEIIANHRLKGFVGNVEKITKANSKGSLELHSADLLTGAVNAAHHIFLNPSAQIHSGKLFLLGKLSAIVGWDHLHYDTYPNSNFNIWHFPMEDYRAVPKTRKIGASLGINNVSYEELRDALMLNK